MRLTVLTGSDSSSSTVSSKGTLCPPRRTPPRALMYSTAKSYPARMNRPLAASAPLKGTTAPKRRLAAGPAAPAVTAIRQATPTPTHVAYLTAITPSPFRYHVVDSIVNKTATGQLGFSPPRAVPGTSRGSRRSTPQYGTNHVSGIPPWANTSR